MSASTVSRPQPGRVNGHEPSDYPITLGDSFKDDSSSRARALRLRYNWEPQHGFSDHKGTLKKTNGQVQLSYEDLKSGSSSYSYNLTPSDETSGEADQKLNQLALIFDPQKSAYVLEQFSHSFDLNLAAAHDQNKREVQQHKQIGNQSSQSRGNQSNDAQRDAEQDEDEADSANPFDFRHFLSEAKENAEKANQITGSRTPVPGSRTPISGISSPSLGAGRFLSAGTPQFRPIPTSAPLVKKPVASKPATSAATKKQPAKRRPAAGKSATQQPLSKEIVSDSSDDDTGAVSFNRPPTSQSRDKGHTRNVSSTSMPRSPHIVVNDGPLVIDMGSPPPEERPRAMIDLEAFRSQTHTPTLGVSSNRPPPARSHLDIDMPDQSDEDDREHEEEEDEEESYHNRAVDEDADMDEDIEEFALDSPRPKKTENDRRDEIEVAPSPPTPLPPPPAEDEDDDLANELYAALGSDESEVSEEE